MAAAWDDVIGECVTTEAVLTEASHLVGRYGAAASLPIELVLTANVQIVPLDPRAHRAALRLMERYADVPMDYADATLVAVADALGIERAFTLDRRGFLSYRTGVGGPFALLPT